MQFGQIYTNLSKGKTIYIMWQQFLYTGKTSFGIADWVQLVFSSNAHYSFLRFLFPLSPVRNNHLLWHRRLRCLLPQQDGCCEGSKKY